MRKKDKTALAETKQSTAVIRSPTESEAAELTVNIRLRIAAAMRESFVGIRRLFFDMFDVFNVFSPAPFNNCHLRKNMYT
jgi:hypothetical protein